MFWLENIAYYEKKPKRYYLIKDVYVYDENANAIAYHNVDINKNYSNISYVNILSSSTSTPITFPIRL